MPSDTTTAAWGYRYREARERRGWTQHDVAAASGVNQSIVSRLESGGGASMRSHLAIANVLGVSLDALAREAS
jgi:transcriptional regulator with XRE-family HTH domain